MSQYPPDPPGGSTTDQAREQVRETAQAARDTARGAAGQARGRLRDQVDQRSTQAAERLSGAAADARSVAEELRRQGKGTPAAMVEQAAGQADRWADYLKRASGDRILRDVEDFARNQPWAVAAGGLVLGFGASRFLKASSSRRYRASAGDVGAYQPPWHDASAYPGEEPPPSATTHAPVVEDVEDAVPGEPAQRLPRAE